MLSFELSAIDLILAIAVIILLILYITKSSAKTPTEEKVFAEKEMERPTPKPQVDSTECPYGVGYLKKLDKGASIPDKCLGCSKIMECFSANK